MENELEKFNNIKQEIDAIILERSKYLINKKFKKYNKEITKIYSKFNINKSRRIDILGSPQIDINNLGQILILVLKEINLFLLELSSPKDIFISFFLINSQKESEMEGIIKKFQHEIISKDLTEKYNNIFYEEKIKPSFIPLEYNIKKYNDDNKNNKEEIIKEINISEYNSKGRKIKNKEELQEENENNMREYNIGYDDDNDENRYIINTPLKVNKNNNDISKVIKLDQNILYIENLPRLLIDYLMANPNLAIVEIDEEFSKELDIYNKTLLHKIQKYDELYSKKKIKENNKKMLGNKLSQHSLQLKKVQNSIELYEKLIKDKREKGENAIFLEDMLNKLKSKEIEITNNINEMRHQSQILNMKSNINNKYDISKKNNILINENSNLMESSDILNSNNIKSNLKYKEIPKILFNTNNIQTIQNIIERPKIIKKYKLTNSSNKIKKLNNVFNNNESQMLNNINFSKVSLSTKSSLLQTITSKEKDSKILFSRNKTELKRIFSTELTDEVINTALNEIFNFYSSFNELDNELISLDLFNRFCQDFKIAISQSIIESIFYESLSNEDNKTSRSKNISNNKINFHQFKTALSKLSLEMHELKKKKYLRSITDKKSIINYMELREYMRQEEEKNHNKFTEKITGHISNKSLEKDSFEFLSKYKKLKTDISKLEFEYEKESKKTEQKILENFYQYLGIGYLPSFINCYKNKLKTKSNIFVENALKKYGNIIFRNSQNINGNNITMKTRDSYNFNSSKTNLTSNILTDKRPLSTNLLKFKIHPNPISTNDSIKLIPNTNKLNIKQSQSTINLDKYNRINNRYNLKDIDELEEFELSKINQKKIMDKNLSTAELKGINSFDNMSILPKIDNMNNNNIRFQFLKGDNQYLENQNI